MTLEAYIQKAKEAGASDVHLEGGLPAALRVRGALKTLGEPLKPQDLRSIAQELLNDAEWHDFATRRSFDLAKTIRGVRCRINILHSARGVGFAIRLLSNFKPTITNLNLHSELSSLVRSHHHGLILASGPTGSGKTSTLAALVHEINSTEARHIITLESPIEYVITPTKSFVRQREVGRDTPSFEQGLYDALREDPDVLMVGEMRDPETIRLTLNAAETGHLVLATLHSATVGEALSRIVSAFAPEIQSGIAAQLADSLVAVVCQRLVYRDQIHLNVPECEILLASSAAKAIVRQAQFAKLQTVLETGGREGNFSFERYREWLDRRTDFYIPSAHNLTPLGEDLERPAETRPTPATKPAPLEGVIEIPDEDDDLSRLMSQLEKRGNKPK